MRVDDHALVPIRYPLLCCAIDQFRSYSGSHLVSMKVPPQLKHTERVNDGFPQIDTVSYPRQRLRCSQFQPSIQIIQPFL